VSAPLGRGLPGEARRSYGHPGRRRQRYRFAQDVHINGDDDAQTYANTIRAGLEGDGGE
jgi:hypothetical protein